MRALEVIDIRACRALYSCRMRAEAFRTVSLFIVVFVAGLVLEGCLRQHLYQGDGRFVDVGPTAAIDRYILDLGPVNISDRGVYRYSIARLPSVEMIIGFDVIAPGDEQLRKSRPLDALVEVILIRGQVVIHERERLAQWTWSSSSSEESRAFVYRRGDVRERSLESGVIGFERLGVKADGGWGNYFRPRSGERYLLTLSVLEPARVDQHYVVRLLVKGGGWKA